MREILSGVPISCSLRVGDRSRTTCIGGIGQVTTTAITASCEAAAAATVARCSYNIFEATVANIAVGPFSQVSHQGVDSSFFGPNLATI